MSNPIKHHFVSQFYLRNFTKNGTDKETLFCYDKIKDTCFSANPKDICFIKNFNTISLSGKEYIVEIEQAKIESILSRSFKEIILNKSYPNEEQFAHIINFIALVALRNPKMRSLFDDFYKQIANKLMMMTMATEEIYLDQCHQAGIKEEDIIPYEKQKEFIEDKTRYTLEINQEVHIQSELQTLDHLHDILLQRNWYLMVSDETIGEFITSDYPVSLISLVDRGAYGVGFGLQATEVVFPISKHLVFIGVFEEYPNLNKTIFATKDLVESINIRTFEFANKQVYSMKQVRIKND